MPDLNEIIGRLERATGADFALDRDIHLQVFTTITLPQPPCYTSSIDDALTLLEPGWEYSISTIYGVAWVELPLNDTRIGSITLRRADGNVPLALCTTILKARATLRARSRGE